MSLNGSTIVRNQIAAPRLFQRLEKQLAKPQGPQVAAAIVQLLVDWAHLFGSEELGVRSRAALAQPRVASMAVGCSPSPAVLAMEEEMRIGIPPVAPIRGEDFIKAMYRGAGDLSTLSGGAAAGGAAPRVQTGCVPGGAPPPIAAHAVPLLCARMKTDAQRLTAALAACRAAARSGRQGELVAAMDGAYREAERCSQWRRRVQDFTQKDDNPAALSSVLAATDVINTALRDWQDFASLEVYHLMRIAVPPLSAASLRPSSSQARPSARGPGAGAGGGRPTDVADLLNIGTAPAAPAPAAAAAQQQPAAAAAGVPHSQSASQLREFDPFGDPVPSANPGVSAGSNYSGHNNQGSANPFANPFPGGAPGVSMFPVPPAGAPGGSGPRATGQPGRSGHQASPSLADWDPFQSPTPSRPPAAAAAASVFGTAQAAGIPAPTGPSSGAGWMVFDGDGPTLSAGGSQSAPFSPALTSTLPSGALPSPANSGLSVTSTPNGAASCSPRSVTAATPHHPVATPLPPAAIGSFGSSPQLGNGVRRPPGTASATAAALGADDRAGGLSRSTTAPALAQGTGANCVSNANNARNGAPGAPPTLDWRPEFERLAAELRALAPPSAQAAGGGTAAAGPPLAEVLSRVRGLCEELAGKHGRCVAELKQRHAEELRDVKSRSLAKLREVTSASAGQTSAAAVPDGLGSAQGSGSLPGNGAAAAGAAGAAGGALAAGPARAGSYSRPGPSALGTGRGASTSPGQGALFQGLQLHQQATGQAQGQPLRPNGFVPMPPAGAGPGRSAPADFSLI